MVHERAGCGTHDSNLNSSVAHVMPFQSGKVLGQEGTHGRIATVWLHWADCVRVVVPGLLRTCRTTIFVDQEETFLEFRRKSEVVTKRKKRQLGVQSACASHASDLLETKSGFWGGACVVCSFSFPCCDQSCVCFSGSSRSHIILVFAGRTGASSAGGTDGTFLRE